MNYPPKIKVIKSFRFHQMPFCFIKENEIGTYFESSDVYVFDVRDWCVPYVDRTLALKRLGWWFEKV
jgi:hypothetical protein